MSTWTSILFDIAILTVLGCVYYLYQKRRIISVSREEILEDLQNFRQQLNQFADESKNSDSYQDLIQFVEEFELYFQNKDLTAIVNQEGNFLNKDLVEFQKAISKQITDHLNVNNQKF